MDINFKEEFPDGSVEFTGKLTNEEVSFLLKFSLMSLLSRGLVPESLVVKTENDDEAEAEAEAIHYRKDLN